MAARQAARKSDVRARRRAVVRMQSGVFRRGSGRSQGDWKVVEIVRSSDARCDPRCGSELDHGGLGRVRSMSEVCWKSVRRSGV
jgi:hypothetical protein